ncbi:hypothetical protein [Rhodococcus rhodochrous]|uniref:Uncharacterized protein n=1 Tax=Rhodococcus rhodochrous TaxID=1829 RepID=A0AA46X1U9_RHORH|nr:hypothetical protein [Rhodococcus rhodochrous]UZF48510.1 hypothetical protein KUM34_029515 [Rhodococcus rhodochrous]
MAGTALPTLLALLFLGMFSLAVATDAVPSDNKAVAFAPAFYSVTVMGGLVTSILGFEILEAVLRRSDDPTRGWARAGLLILVAVSVMFVIACLLALPAVALGTAANGIGASIALLRSAPRSRFGFRASWALLWTSLTLAIGAAAWLAVTVRNALGCQAEEHARGCPGVRRRGEDLSGPTEREARSEGWSVAKRLAC